MGLLVLEKNSHKPKLELGKSLANVIFGQLYFITDPLYQCATILHSLRTNLILVKTDIFFLLETINVQVYY